MSKQFPPQTTEQQQHLRPPTQRTTTIVQDGQKPTCSKSLRTHAATLLWAQTLPSLQIPSVSTAQAIQKLRTENARRNPSFSTTQLVAEAPQRVAALTVSDRKAERNGIYVSNLHPSVDTSLLDYIFCRIGMISESYVALEKGTKKSLGYGIVHFHDPASVQISIARYNGVSIKNQKMKIEVYRTPEERQNAPPQCQATNLYIKNFSGAFSFDEELINLFRVYGPITSYKFEKDERTKGYKGFGFICFQLPRSASEAIRNLHGRLLRNGKELYVVKHESKDTRGSNANTWRNTVHPAPKSPNGMFIAPASTHFPRQYQVACQPHRIPLLMPKPTTAVTHPTSATLWSAGGACVSGLNAAAANVMNPSTSKRRNNVYIKNISGYFDTDMELLHAFRGFGKIISAVVMKDHLGISKGFGFVCFVDPQGAQTAIRAMNMIKLPNGKFLYCGEAQKKEERQVELRELRNKFRLSYSVLRLDSVKGRVKNGLSKNFIQVELCNICFTEMSPLDCVTFDCNHLNCKACLTNWLTVLITERQVNSILCLGENCKMEISPSLLKTLVSKEMYDKYDTILLENFLAAQSDIVHCPTPGCETFVEVDYTQPTRGNCEVCGATFCTNCTDAYHGSGPCDEFESDTEKQRILAEYSTGSSIVKEKLEKRYGKEKLEKELEATLTNSFLTTNCKKCPNCKANIEKNGGCNHMECFSCKTHFCWKCLLVGTRDEIYAHFTAVGTTCEMMR